jgi:endonuclease I
LLVFPHHPATAVSFLEANPVTNIAYRKQEIQIKHPTHRIRPSTASPHSFTPQASSVKRLYALCLLLLPLAAPAQSPGYYDSAYGKTGEGLRRALCDIIKGHQVLSYTPGLWNAYYSTDVKPNGKLASIYSDVPGGTPPYEFTLGADQCGGSTPNAEGGCYNREHLWPQSKFGGNYPMYTDLWIVYPTDSKVNAQRGDWPYGKVSNAAWTSRNGSRLGPNTYPGAPASTAFEPIDSFKGDIARSYFYITTRYYADSNSFQDWQMATRSTLRSWAIQMLLDWHHLDPVSTKEKERNDAAEALQHNRNPFIDEPRFADCIWAGDCAGLGISQALPMAAQIRCSPNPAHNEVLIEWQRLAPDEVLAVAVLNAVGSRVFQAHHPPRTLRVDLRDWPRGLYWLRFQTKQGAGAQKLLLE